MKLLVDIGNSRLKWAIERDGAIGVVRALDHRRPGFIDELRRCWQSVGLPDTAGIAAVAGKPTVEAITLLVTEMWPGLQAKMPRSVKQAFGVTNAYDQPAKLGIDRWLALVAAHRTYAGAICVIDCGTAITIDVMDAAGKHLGGLICPGLVMMKQSLAANTAQLTFDPQPFDFGLASETNVAIANGALAAAVGLVEHTMQRYASGCRLILTGGDAEMLAASLAMPSIQDKELVLKGLAMYCSGETIE
ncbi:MAG: type III pantothenate kinase [Methylomonas sp.]|nr:type III pantothenate kinase [Methylomonas sp.]